MYRSPVTEPLHEQLGTGNDLGLFEKGLLEQSFADDVPWMTFPFAHEPSERCPDADATKRWKPVSVVLITI